MRRVVSPIERGDRGFTIIESMVALMIVFGLMLVLLRTFDMGARVVVETKRQAAASAFASELLERAKSLEWEHMGLATSIKGSSCGTQQLGCYTTIFPDLTVDDPVAGEYGFGGEVVVFANGDAFKPFLNFIEEVDRDKTNFTRYLFITSVRDDPSDPATEKYRRLTAVVRWVAPSGFPEEIRLTSLVSLFTEPSQPLIEGTVTLRGGTMSLEGNLRGTTKVNGGVERQPVQISYVLPALTVSATSDYVASASVAAVSTYADIRWSGPDFIFETADDELVKIDPAEETVAGDDDATSSTPVNVTWATYSLDPPFANGGDPPKDYLAFDLLNTGTVDLGNPTLEEAIGEREAYTAHDVVGDNDNLPYARGSLDGPDIHAIGSIEYFRANSRNPYNNNWGIGTELALPSYRFLPMVRSLNDGLEFIGEVDRDNTLANDRQVSASYTWVGKTLYLFYDDAYNYADNNFRGWVVIELPTLSGVNVQAGEGAVSPLHTPTVSSDLLVTVWNPSSSSYDQVWPTGLETFATSEDQSWAVEIDDGAGGPIVHLLTAPLTPEIQYAFSGSLQISGWSFATANDAVGNQASAGFFADRIVSGTLHYYAYDVFLDDELFDITMNFDAGGANVETAYTDSESS